MACPALRGRDDLKSLRAFLGLLENLTATGEEGATSRRNSEITSSTFAEAGAFLAFLDVQKGRRQERRNKCTSHLPYLSICLYLFCSFLPATASCGPARDRILGLRGQVRPGRPSPSCAEHRLSYQCRCLLCRSCRS